MRTGWKNRVLALILTISMVSSMLNLVQAVDLSEFSDLPDDWSRGAVERAIKNGLLFGSDGKVNASGQLTRAELAAIVVRAFGAAETADLAGYSDVSPSDWYYGEMQKAVKMGIMVGSSGKLNPNALITREEVCSVLYRAFLLPDSGEGAEKFGDAAAISGWAQAAVAAMAAKGYIMGDPNGNVNAAKEITRAEFAQMMDNLVKSYPTDAASGVIEGNAVLRSGENLSGVTIKGDLILADGLGQNAVELMGCTVEGRIIVRGGGEVRLGAGTSAESVVAAASTALRNETGGKIERISIEGSAEQVMLNGVFGTVEVKGDHVTVNADSGASVDKVTVSTSGVTVMGGGKVSLVDVQAGASNTTVTTAKTQITVSKDAGAVSSANGVLEPGQTGTTDKSGQLTGGAPSGGGSSSSGGSSVPPPWTPEEPEGELTLNWHTYAMACGRSLTEGETLTLTAGYDKGELTAPEVRWSSSDGNIVLLKEETGDSVTVQARTSGLADITAALYDGDERIAQDVCRIISVDGYDHTTMQTLTLSAEELTLAKDSAPVTLTPVFFPVDIPGDGTMDTSLEIEDGYDRSVITVSLNEDQPYASYADVGRSPKDTCQILYDQVVVTPAGVGETTFTVKSRVNGRAASCKVTITEEALAVTGLSGGENEVIELTVGKEGENTRQLTATPTGGASEIVWVSSNAHIASVDQNGLVTARSTSNYEERQTNSSALDADDSEFKTVTITATSVQGGFTQTFKVRVLPQDIQASGISINKEKLNLAAGTVGTLYANVSPAAILSPDVTWKSSNEAVLTVTSGADTIFGAPAAELRAISAGRATVTGSYAGFTASCEVTVTEGEVKVSDVSLSGPDRLVRDQVAELTAAVTADATNQRLYWLSDNRTVVTVDQEGNVQGYEPGTAVIYAFALDSLTDAQREILYFTADLSKTADQQAPGDELGEIRNISADGGAKAKLTALLAEGNVKYAKHQIEVDGEASLYLRNLHIPEETITDRSVVLVWNRDSLYSAPGLERTEVYVNGVLAAALDTEMSYTVRGLAPEASYEFQVKTYYGDGESVTETVTARTGAAPVQVLNVLDYGAVGDGSTLDTAAIQAAIDNCPANGEVWLPEDHVFYSGALFLKSDMTFRVDGILLGSPDPKDYPRIVSRWEGWRKIYQPAGVWANENEGTGQDYAGRDNEYVYASLLTVGVYDEGENGYTAPYNTENVTICGSGQINANGYRLGYNEGPNSAVSGGNNGIDYSLCRQDQTIRGHVLVTHNVRNLYVADVMIANGPAWTIDAIYSENMTFDNVAVVALSNYKTNVGNNRNYILNGDGLDVDSSTHVNILNSFFRAGDDAIAAKSGKNLEGWLRGKPTAYLRVSDVYSLGSRYGLIIGSEMAGGAHDILYQNNEFKDNVSDNSMWVKAPTERGGLVEDIVHRDIFNNSSKAAILVKTDYSDSYKKTPAPIHTRIRRLTYENITERGGGVGPTCTFQGKAYSIIRDILICGFPSQVKLAYVDGAALIDMGGYTAGSGVSNVVVYSPEIEKDTGLKLISNAADVKEINTEDGVLSIRKGTTGVQLKAQIQPEKAEVGEQTWALTNSEGTAKEDSAVLAAGDKLTVTAKNGTDSKTYTVQFYKSEEIASSTAIEAVGKTVVKKIEGSRIEVKAGATAGDILAGLRSALGGEVTLSVLSAEGEPVEQGAELTTGCKLRVTAEDGKAAEEYNIAVSMPPVVYNLVGQKVAEKSASLADDKIKPENKNGSDTYFQAEMAQNEYFQLEAPVTLEYDAAYQISTSAKTGSNRGTFDVYLVGEAGQYKLGSISMKDSGGLNIPGWKQLPAGEYQLKFVCTAAGYFTGRSVTFTPGPGQGEVILSEEPANPPEVKPDPEPEDTNNLAQGKKVEASGVDASCKGGQTPEMAVDGIIQENQSDCTNGNWDYVNGWKSQVPSESDDPYIMVDLDGEYALEQLVIFWEKKDSRCYRYIVEVSSDGQNYTQIVDRKDNNDSHKTVDSLSGTARYVKVTILNCKDKNGAVKENTVVTIRELQILGAQADAASQQE